PRRCAAPVASEDGLRRPPARRQTTDRPPPTAPWPCRSRRAAPRACPRGRSPPPSWSCRDRCRPPASPRQHAARAFRPARGSPTESCTRPFKIHASRTRFLGELVEIAQAKKRLSDGRLVACQEQTA